MKKTKTYPWARSCTPSPGATRSTYSTGAIGIVISGMPSRRDRDSPGL